MRFIVDAFKGHSKFPTFLVFLKFYPIAIFKNKYINMCLSYLRCLISIQLRIVWRRAWWRNYVSAEAPFSISSKWRWSHVAEILCHLRTVRRCSWIVRSRAQTVKRPFWIIILHSHYVMLSPPGVSPSRLLGVLYCSGRKPDKRGGNVLLIFRSRPSSHHL